jgi:hypothetical protein
MKPEPPVSSIRVMFAFVVWKFFRWCRKMIALLAKVEEVCEE